MPSARSFLVRDRNKKFDLGVGKNDGPDIATIHDDVVFFCDAALQVKQKRPYLGDGGHLGGVGGDLIGPDESADLFAAKVNLLPVGFISQ